MGIMFDMLGLQGAETACHLHETIHGDILIADCQHMIVKKCLINHRNSFRPKWIIQIEPNNLGTQRCIKRSDFNAHLKLLNYHLGTGVAEIPSRFIMNSKPPTSSILAI